FYMCAECSQKCVFLPTRLPEDPLIVAEQSARYSIRLSFVEYLKVGFPLALVTTATAVLYFKF
ncbi:MAG: hypothetical protein HKL95_04040, partial [Phycisphaerae bacterium]|nr:hypothetical protein [Phycisphaerae bacterium]